MLSARAETLGFANQSGKSTAVAALYSTALIERATGLLTEASLVGIN